MKYIAGLLALLLVLNLANFYLGSDPGVRDMIELEKVQSRLPEDHRTGNVCVAFGIFRLYQSRADETTLTGNTVVTPAPDSSLQDSVGQVWILARARIKYGLPLACAGLGEGEVRLVDELERIIDYYGLPKGVTFRRTLLTLARINASGKALLKI